MRLHAMVKAAARGQLPSWSNLSRARRDHVGRVAALLGDWAEQLKLSDSDQQRWRAAGLLHDALREVPPDELRPIVPEPLRNVSGKLLHGPAAAERLRQEGVDDEPLLRAVAYHTIGHPELDELGRALYIADYVEPGRRHNAERLAELRARMPGARNDVLVDVLRDRMTRLISEGRTIRAETMGFWNAATNREHGTAQQG